MKHRNLKTKPNTYTHLKSHQHIDVMSKPDASIACICDVVNTIGAATTSKEVMTNISNALQGGDLIHREATHLQSLLIRVYPIVPNQLDISKISDAEIHRVFALLLNYGGEKAKEAMLVFRETGLNRAAKYFGLDIFVPSPVDATVQSPVSECRWMHVDCYLAGKRSCPIYGIENTDGFLRRYQSYLEDLGYDRKPFDGSYVYKMITRARAAIADTEGRASRATPSAQKKSEREVLGQSGVDDLLKTLNNLGYSLADLNTILERLNSVPTDTNRRTPGENGHITIKGIESKQPTSGMWPTFGGEGKCAIGFNAGGRKKSCGRIPGVTVTVSRVIES